MAGSLKKFGWSVVDTSALGDGYPDITAGKRGVTELFEVKGDSGSLTPAQIEFIARWRGSPVRVVKSGIDALRQVGEVANKPPPY